MPYHIPGGDNQDMYPLITPYQPLLGDINDDGVVDAYDLTLLLDVWGTNDVYADLNGDGVVNVSDLLILLGNWG